QSGEYGVVLKFDISNFYPSIRHEELMKRLRRFIRQSLPLCLIENAIKQNSTGVSKNNKGVPQGLSISNILAALYLRNIDAKYEKINTIVYQRYVDDILVLCKEDKQLKISKDIVHSCSEIGLEVYDPVSRPDKSTLCNSSEEFSYIGYRYNPEERTQCLISTRKESKQKLIDSLTGIFTSYHRSKSKSLALLQWRVNLRITGCVSENSGKGWIFFFAEIEDKQLLYELDFIINSLCTRFSVSFNKKKFIRAWHEINNNRWRKKYFPNFDTYDIDEMSEIVSTYVGKEKNKLEMTEDEIVIHFWRIIRKELKDMATDIQDHNYI
ncbi:MAG: reverse transcriptase domain-containing protein, partial [Pseudomonadales bacterium]